MLRCVERVSDPVDKGLVVDLGAAFPCDTLGVSAANRDDVFGGLPLNAGGPSGSRSLSSPWHNSLNHYREYTEKSLISQTNSFDFRYDSVYDINMTDMKCAELRKDERQMKTKIFYAVAGAEDFVIVDGQVTSLPEWALKEYIPAGAEYLDCESFPDVADAQFGL